MPTRRSTMLRRVLTLLAAVLVLKVTAAVMLGYVDYFPANFDSDFLRGRDAYFFGPYRWAFYSHIAVGPFTLVAGLALMIEQLRRRRPQLHRMLGRTQVACILLLLTPSGLWMAFQAASGTVATASFVTLSLATAACAALGWRTAVQRRFAAHREWMWRTFLLLCSAVALRILGGFATVAGIDAPWYDPAASWACWVLPLAVFEAVRFRRSTTKRPVQSALTSRQMTVIKGERRGGRGAATAFLVEDGSEFLG